MLRNRVARDRVQREITRCQQGAPAGAGGAGSSKVWCREPSVELLYKDPKKIQALMQGYPEPFGRAHMLTVTSQRLFLLPSAAASGRSGGSTATAPGQGTAATVWYYDAGTTTDGSRPTWTAFHPDVSARLTQAVAQQEQRLELKGGGYVDLVFMTATHLPTQQPCRVHPSSGVASFKLSHLLDLEPVDIAATRALRSWHSAQAQQRRECDESLPRDNDPDLSNVASLLRCDEIDIETWTYSSRSIEKMLGVHDLRADRVLIELFDAGQTIATAVRRIGATITCVHGPAKRWETVYSDHGVAVGQVEITFESTETHTSAGPAVVPPTARGAVDLTVERMEWMWADAGLSTALAKINPFRWIGGAPGEIAEKLQVEAKAKECEERAVRVRWKKRVEQGGQEETVELPCVQAALQLMGRMDPSMRTTSALPATPGSAEPASTIASSTEFHTGLQGSEEASTYEEQTAKAHELLAIRAEARHTCTSIEFQRRVDAECRLAIEKLEQLSAARAGRSSEPEPEPQPQPEAELEVVNAFSVSAGMYSNFDQEMAAYSELLDQQLLDRLDQTSSTAGPMRVVRCAQLLLCDAFRLELETQMLKRWSAVGDDTTTAARELAPHQFAAASGIIVECFAALDELGALGDDLDDDSQPLHVRLHEVLDRLYRWTVAESDLGRKYHKMVTLCFANSLRAEIPREELQDGALHDEGTTIASDIVAILQAILEGIAFKDDDEARRSGAAGCQLHAARMYQHVAEALTAQLPALLRRSSHAESDCATTGMEGEEDPPSNPAIGAEVRALLWARHAAGQVAPADTQRFDDGVLLPWDSEYQFGDLTRQGLQFFKDLVVSDKPKPGAASNGQGDVVAGVAPLAGGQAVAAAAAAVSEAPQQAVGYNLRYLCRVIRNCDEILRGFDELTQEMLLPTLFFGASNFEDAKRAGGIHEQYVTDIKNSLQKVYASANKGAPVASHGHAIDFAVCMRLAITLWACGVLQYEDRLGES
jgi:hypothetical protein